MLVLVANLGSTSFKFKVLDSDKNFAVVARGSYERIGQPNQPWNSHAQVIDDILNTLNTNGQQPHAIGFKAVHGGPISTAVRVDDHVIQTMQQFADLAPAHNPVYIAAMKLFAEKLPGVPQVAAFETAFHQTIPPARQAYAVPIDWIEKHGIRRYGFHGASHRYCINRAMQLAPNARRIINCHLGGSSSLCAAVDGKSIACSLGLTPQTGLPHNNRVGDFDPFALLKLTKLGHSLDDILNTLSKKSGLLGLSNLSNDLRDIEQAADSGNTHAKLAIDVLIESIRHYLGAFIVAAGGIDLLSFTGGIGENASRIRAGVCESLSFLGIDLDPHLNQTRSQEVRISRDQSRASIWIIPTDEERVVAQQTVETLTHIH